VSTTGMLLRGTEGFSHGAHFDFVFSLPGDPRPLEGTAQVVRKTDSGREPVEGVGVRFVHLREDGKYRLERFLSSRVH